MTQTEPLILRALRGEVTAEVPVWLMRQAGRYLPEYQAIRSKNTINEVINNSDLATEVTLQPLERFPLDAAIIFADLLTPFQGLGFEFEFLPGSGPHVHQPISTAACVDRVQQFDPFEKTAGTMGALRQVKAALTQRGDAAPKALIGFSGAPFTSSSYLIEGKSNPKLHGTKAFIFNQPAAWHRLQEKLVPALRDYLLAQVESGAQALQIFDSWLGGLSVLQYQEYVEPYLKQLISEVKAKTDVPVIFFATAVAHLYPHFSALPADVIGVDWRQDLHTAGQLLGGSPTLQGNLDPLLLFGPEQSVVADARRIVDQAKKLQNENQIDGFVFNLGHGILPKTPISNVSRLVETVKTYA